MTKKKVWILYLADGDADIGDPSESHILECEASGKMPALRTMLDFWRDHDGVLYEYDENGKDLENEHMIGPMRDGIEALLGRCG